MMTRKQKTLAAAPLPIRQESFGRRLCRDLYRNRWIYVIALVCLTWYFIFCYAPMGGIVIAFKDYRPARGLWRSKWVGLKWFKEFIGGYYFGRLVRNTLVINSLGLAIGFTTPIIFALLINEIRNSKFKRTIQTITYLPHFVSTVVAVGLVCNLLSYNGLLNQITALFGAKPQLWLSTPKYFPWIHELSSLWQNMGYSSIIFLAALTNGDVQLYEAAMVDGAGRLRRLWHITLPAIRSTIVLMLILRMGSMLDTGYDHLILMANALNRSVSQTLDVFVYEQGLKNGQYSYASAVGLMKAVVSVTLVVTANKIAHSLGEQGLY